MTLIRFQSVHKTFDSPGGPILALAQVSLKIESGGICAIAGPSGSGKSTVLSLIAGLDRPTRGTVWVDGADVGSMRARERTAFRLARIGLVFQSNNLIPVLTVAENVALPLSLLGVSARDARRRVMDLLDDLGLTALKARRPLSVSGGQQQRVAIARALVTRPRLVLADEPTAHLDTHSGDDVMALLRSISDRQGSTFVVSTHDPAIQAAASARIELRGGRVVAPEATQREESRPCPTCYASRSGTFAATHGAPRSRAAPSPSAWSS